MATEKDFYAVLGVAKDASTEHIKKTYKKLAREWHPDLNPKRKAEAERRFKEISEAHAVLSDPEKRKRYDEFGMVGLDPSFDAEKYRRYASGPRGGRAQGFPGGFTFQQEGDPQSFDDIFGQHGGPGGGSIFEQMFRDATGRNARGPAGKKRGRRAAPPPTGEDVEHEAEIDLLDTLRGATLGLELDRGSGRERIDVKIPAGVREGQRVRLASLGARGPGGPGDLYVRVKVRAHPQLERRGDDLVLDAPVTVGEAIGGARITVPSPWSGTIDLSVPPGTSSGQMLRVRGQGMPLAAGERGDLFVRIMVKVPRAGGASALEAAKTIDELYEKDVRRDLHL